MRFINEELISSPYNWIIVLFMVLLSMALIAIVSPTKREA
jgi:hypothetical protein